MTYQRSPRFVVRSVGEHHVLVPAEGGLPADVYALLLDGPVALTLWETLASPRTRAELVEEVLARFEVDRERASADVEAFLEQLATAGCLA